MKQPKTAGTDSGEPTQEQPLALRLWTALARAYDAVRRHAEAEAARRGLTLGEIAVLDALLRNGPMTQGQAQRSVFVSSGGITFLVDRLVRRGLVQRTHHPTDRRARLAALTPEGERLVQEILPPQLARIKAAMGGVGKKDRREALRLLRALGQYAASLPVIDPAEGEDAA